MVQQKRYREHRHDWGRSHGAGYRDLILDAADRVRPTLLVVLDGVQASGEKETLPLDGVSDVMLMTPIAGG